MEGIKEKKQFKIRDKRNKGWFYIDNEYLNGYAKIIGATATALYISLCRHADNNQQCFPSRKLLAEEFGISEKTVKRHIGRLKFYNIISVEQEKNDQGKFRNNLFTLMDKDVWLKPWGQKGATVRDKNNETVGTICPSTVGSNCPPTVGSNLPHKDTNMKNTNIKDTNICKIENFAGKEINSLITKFKEINPTYERLFANKTQRSALERLVKKFGYNEIEKLLEALPQIFGKPYAPRITTPYQLEQKLGDLMAFLAQEKSKKPVGVIIS